MKSLITALIVLTATALLAGCEAFETAFPRTSTGFYEDGIVGAVSGASSGLVEIGDVICTTAGLPNVVISANVAAVLLEKEWELASRREKRKAICALFSLDPDPFQTDATWDEVAL